MNIRIPADANDVAKAMLDFIASQSARTCIGKAISRTRYSDKG